MAKLDMQTLAKSMQMIGEDRLVELKLLQPGVIIGIWKTKTSHPVLLFSYHYSLVLSINKWDRNLNVTDLAWGTEREGSLCRTGAPLPLSCSRSTFTDWWKEASRDPQFGRLHLKRHLSCTCSSGMQWITFSWLVLKSLQDRIYAPDVTRLCCTAGWDLKLQQHWLQYFTTTWGVKIVPHFYIFKMFFFLSVVWI